MYDMSMKTMVFFFLFFLWIQSVKVKRACFLPSYGAANNRIRIVLAFELKAF